MTFYHRGLFRSGSVRISVDSLQLRYGMGFFETILYEKQKICLLAEHLERLSKNFDAFNLCFEKIDFEPIFKKLLSHNQLLHQSARLNIFCPIDDFKSPSSPILTVSPLVVEENLPVQLITYPDCMGYFLSQYKSMNYMYCILARHYAEERGYRDSLLCDQSENIIETSTSSLILFDGNDYMTPASKFALRSIALEQAKKYLDVDARTISKSQLSDFKHIYCLNSIRGIRPVSQVDEKSFIPDFELCKKWSSKIKGITD